MQKAQFRIVPFLLVGTLLSSCTHEPKTVTGDSLATKFTARDVASEYVVPMVNPVSNKTYWDEYTELHQMFLLKRASPYIANRIDQLDELLKNMILPGTKDVKDIIEAERLFATFKPELFHFLMWMRANPIATFKGLRTHQQNPDMPQGIFKFSSFTDKISDKKYKVGDTYVITKMDDVLEVLENPKVFSVRNYRDKMLDSVGRFMLSYDETAINFGEKPWMRSMLPASDLPKIRSMVQRISQDSIRDQRYVGNDFNNKEFGHLEAVNDYARRVPAIFTQEYFGIKGRQLSDITRWSRATQDDFFHNLPNDPKVRARSAKAGKEMNEYLTTYIRSRGEQMAQEMSTRGITRDPQNPQYQEYVASLDVLSRLILDKNFTADAFKNERIRTNIMGTLVGGIETTQAAVVQAMDELMKRKSWFKYATDLAQRHEAALVSGDQAGALLITEKMEELIWEALRFKPVNPIVVRYAEQDYQLKGHVIPKGSLLLVSTQSAMFDEDYFKSAEYFIPDRINSPEFTKLKELRGYFADKQDAFSKAENHAASGKWTKFKKSYFHLGYGHHRCLGDYIGEIHVPEMVTQLLKLPNLRVADGQDGRLDFRTLRATSAFGDKYYFSFPEKYVLEFDTRSQLASVSKILEKKPLEIANPAYPYEEYLTDHDRDLYRSCLAGWDIGVTSADIKKNYKLFFEYLGRSGETHDLNSNGENKDLLFCRMPKPFQECMVKEFAVGGYNRLEDENSPSKGNHLAGFDKHLGSFEKCSVGGALSSTQSEFYENVFFGKKLDSAKITTQHRKPMPEGYEFENVLKFYDRFNSRESMLNPLGWTKIPSSKVALLYTRLNLGFRLCYGTKVNFEKLSRPEAYAKCRDGVYFPKQFESMGGLSLVERYYMLKHYLGEQDGLAFLKELSSLDAVPEFEAKLAAMTK